ncbi:MAG: hypothetical protein OXT09_31950 [Myxococcales bacterium]|nr:hypothetical protein [Myxococcales bacterium]
MLVACGPEPTAAREPLPPAPAPIPEAADWVERVRPAATPGRATGEEADGRVRAAVMDDEVQDSADPVHVRRLVYRVSFIVPPAFRERKRPLSPPVGELHVDVSERRLRARFVGPGWPVDEGAELRLRADVPGVYLFDGEGGRSVGGGQLASWFEGRTDGRSKSRVRVRREFAARRRSLEERQGPGERVCSLLAEWTNQDRTEIERRCRGGEIPPGFRFGPWSAELTAIVPMELPRYAMRADEVDPPEPIEHLPGRPMLDASALAQLSPHRVPATPLEPGPLTVHNRTDTRVVLLAQGVPIAWVDAGQTAAIEGLSPGRYRIGALRPLGILRMAPKLIEVPGELRIGR